SLERFCFAADLKNDGFGEQSSFKCIVAETSTEDQCPTIVGYAIYFFG
uniref:Uncharacterized protein n=1 Tax=Callorhinchus milii TaxID=7868 RepID=A0A4W3GGR9_CALMI